MPQPTKRERVPSQHLVVLIKGLLTWNIISVLGDRLYWSQSDQFCSKISIFYILTNSASFQFPINFFPWWHHFFSFLITHHFQNLLLLLSHFSCVRLCATPQTAAHQAPLSLEFSRQEHWSGLPFLSPMHESEKWKVKSLSRVWLFATLWTIAYQAPLSVGFSRQEYWSGLPFPSLFQNLPSTKLRIFLNFHLKCHSWLFPSFHFSLFT